MPIDARIPLGVQPPQVQMPDFLQQAGQAMSLRALVDQQHMVQLQAREQQMRLAQMQQDMADEVKAREILMSSPDARSALPLLQRAGLGTKAIKYVTDYANLNEAFSKMDEAQHDVTTKRLQTLGNIANEIRNAPDDKKQVMWQGALKYLEQNKLMDVASLPQQYPGDDMMDVYAQSVVSVENQQKHIIAQQRAQSYAASVESLANSREAKSEADLKKLDIAAQDLQRKIEADSMLDARERQRLTQQLTMHRQTLAQRMVEEAGRNRRFDKGEEGKNTRQQKSIDASMEKTKLVQDRMDERQRMALEKGFTPSQIASATHQAIRDMGYETLDDIDEDSVDAFNNLVESYLGRQMPRFGTKAGGFMGMGTDATVTPGPQVNPRSTAPATKIESSSHDIPQQIIDRLPVGRKVKLTAPDGQVMWVVKDASGKITRQ
jgi:hypothetical protein